MGFIVFLHLRALTSFQMIIFSASMRILYSVLHSAICFQVFEQIRWFIYTVRERDMYSPYVYLPLIPWTVASSALKKRHMASPPKPQENGCVTFSAAAMDTHASAAFPPFRRMSVDRIPKEKWNKRSDES
jgi:hypothetical protein